MDDRLLFLMSRAHHALKNHIRSEFTRDGVRISPAQMGILFALRMSDGLPMSELGRIIHIDNAAVTRHADAMERDGYVKRVDAPDDRRKSIIRITAKGRDESERCKKAAQRINASLKAGFTPAEIETFVRVLNGFIEKSTKTDGGRS